MGLTQTTMSWREVKKHNYIVAHGKVYDAPLFMKHHKHPPCITKKYGTDCSIDYDFHCNCEKKEWKKYQIGVINS